MTAAAGFGALVGAAAGALAGCVGLTEVGAGAEVGALHAVSATPQTMASAR